MKWMVLMMAWVIAMPLWAADLETDLAGIQQRWAEIQYQLPESQREKAFKVLGWPLGFGDDDKARSYLQKALAINPDGIDANYFFGDFLLEQGEPERAQTYLRKVLKAPGRPGREIADAGRREEARKRLDAL